MGEDTRQIMQTIRAERRDLERNIGELQEHAKALTDWRTHYRRHTGPSLALAFGGGVVLGLLAGGQSPNGIRRRRDRTGPVTTASIESQAPRARKLAALRTLADNPRARRQVTEAWDHMLEALIGVASAKAIDLIANVVPGFRDEYRTRTNEWPNREDVRRPDISPR